MLQGRAEPAAWLKKTVRIAQEAGEQPAGCHARRRACMRSHISTSSCARSSPDSRLAACHRHRSVSQSVCLARGDLTCQTAAKKH